MNTKQIATDYEISILKSKIAVISSECDELQSKLTSKSSELRMLQEEMCKLNLKKTKITIKSLLQLHCNYFPYQAVKDFMNQFDCVATSGWYPDTGHRGIRIALNQNKSFDGQLREINQFIKHLPVIKGYKRLSIFEETLSERGCFEILIEGQKAKLIKIVYGSENDVTKWMPIKDVIKYVYDNHPYERINQS